MSSWVADHASTLYLLLGVIGIGLAGAWWLARSKPRRGGVPASARPYLFSLAGVAVLLSLVWVADHFADSDSKQIERALQTMSAAVEARNVDQIFAHVSDSFRLGGGTKTSFRPFVERTMRSGGVSSVKVWDINVKNLSREQRAATVTFRVKARGSQVGDPGIFNCQAEFALDQDGQWRLKSFKLFQPQIDPMNGEPLPLPFN